MCLIWLSCWRPHDCSSEMIRACRISQRDSECPRSLSSALLSPTGGPREALGSRSLEARISSLQRKPYGLLVKEPHRLQTVIRGRGRWPNVGVARDISIERVRGGRDDGRSARLPGFLREAPSEVGWLHHRSFFPCLP